MTEDEMYDIIRGYEDSERYYHERNIELQDENARLRSCLSDDAENARQIIGENAKLRELVKAFWWCTENFDIPNKCDRCLLNQSSKIECECEVIMRELGIEVGE